MHKSETEPQRSHRVEEVPVQNQDLPRVRFQSGPTHGSSCSKSLPFRFIEKEGSKLGIERLKGT